MLTARIGLESLCSDDAVAVAVAVAVSAVLRLVAGQERLAECVLSWSASCPLHLSRFPRLSPLVCCRPDLSLHLSIAFPTH